MIQAYPPDWVSKLEIKAGFSGLLRSGRQIWQIGDFWPFRLQCALKPPLQVRKLPHEQTRPPLRPF